MSMTCAYYSGVRTENSLNCWIRGFLQTRMLSSLVGSRRIEECRILVCTFPGIPAATCSTLCSSNSICTALWWMKVKLHLVEIWSPLVSCMTLLASVWRYWNSPISVLLNGNRPFWKRILKPMKILIRRRRKIWRKEKDKEVEDENCLWSWCGLPGTQYTNIFYVRSC